MYKKTKDMIKLIFIVLAIVSIPLFFIAVETIQKFKVLSETDPEKVISGTLDELYNEVVTSPKNTAPSVIRKCLNEIFDLMNEKQYQKLYTLLTDDIKDLMFPTEESFYEFMISYLNDKTYSPRFSEYTKFSKNSTDVFSVKTYFLPYSTEKNLLLSETTAEKTDTFVIYFNEDGTYNFSFLSYVGAGKSEDIKSTENFSFKISKTHLYTNQTTYFIEIENKTDSPIFIEEKSIYAYTGLMPKYYGQSVLIPAKETVTVRFTVYTGLSLSESLPMRVQFKGVHVNGKVYMFSLKPVYPVKVSSFDF